MNLLPASWPLFKGRRHRCRTAFVSENATYSTEFSAIATCPTDNDTLGKLCAGLVKRVAPRTSICVVAALANGLDHWLHAAPSSCTVGDATRFTRPVQSFPDAGWVI
jgi:hypothetical protein